MRKVTRNYWMFVLQAILGLALGVSSFLLWVVFPRGYSAGRALWVDIHKWGGLALCIVVLVHVAMHGAWIARKTRRVLNELRGATLQVIARLASLAFFVLGVESDGKEIPKPSGLGARLQGLPCEPDPLE